MGSGNPRILIVEDEPSQLELLSYNLSAEKYDVFQASNAEDGALLLAEKPIDLVLLDWMLPETSGLEFCRQIKKTRETSKIPVIMLTARGEEEDKVRGLDIGADDYMVKPYAIKELLARVRACLRRSGELKGNDILSFGPIEMDLSRHTVVVGNDTLNLGTIEFKLLRSFLESPNRVHSRDFLLDHIWDSNPEVGTRTVDVHIGRLRKHLKPFGQDHLIRTVRGFGYSLDDIA